MPVRPYKDMVYAGEAWHVPPSLLIPGLCALGAGTGHLHLARLRCIPSLGLTPRLRFRVSLQGGLVCVELRILPPCHLSYSALLRPPTRLQLALHRSAPGLQTLPRPQGPVCHTRPGEPEFDWDEIPAGLRFKSVPVFDTRGVTPWRGT
jgi:hypothetical protein